MGTGMPEGVKTSMGWALGLGVIALILIIMLILFGNLSGNVGFGQTSSTVVNDSVDVTDAGVDLTSAVGAVNPAFTSVIVTNSSADSITFDGNFTITGINVVNLTAEGGGAMNFSYTLGQDELGKIHTDSVITNYSQSAVNISAQFPTVGTIIGIALLLIVLIGILVFAIKQLTAVTGSSGSGSLDRGGFG